MQDFRLNKLIFWSSFLYFIAFNVFYLRKRRRVFVRNGMAIDKNSLRSQHCFWHILLLVLVLMITNQSSSHIYRKLALVKYKYVFRNKISLTGAWKWNGKHLRHQLVLRCTSLCQRIRGEKSLYSRATPNSNSLRYCYCPQKAAVCFFFYILFATKCTLWNEPLTWLT